MNARRHEVELSADARRRLDDLHPYACERYDHYRRQGYGPRAALHFAHNWARNMSEQRERRLAHDTGAIR